MILSVTTIVAVLGNEGYSLIILWQESHRVGSRVERLLAFLTSATERRGIDRSRAVAISNLVSSCFDAANLIW